MNATARSDLKPTPEQIAQHAYHLWEQDGCPTGQDTKYWLQAEKDLQATGKTTSPMTAIPRANSATILGANRSSKRTRLSARR